jgi:RHS repeat-associated protein
VSSGENDILTTAYAYLAAANQNETTTLISTLTNSGANWSETLNYTYDALGNIETISEGSTQKAKYYYDGLNQLIREDNAWLGKTVAYTYDNGGNILLVEEYTLTSGALDGLTATNSYTYLYGDSNWKDKLTSYDGKAITYDSIGNRTSYDGYSYTWQAGRELAGINGNGLTATYKYDADGIRTEKTVNGVTTAYTLEGADVVFETDGTNSIWYTYDGDGVLVSMELNGVKYYYVFNLQGDVVGLTDGTGAKVVSYLYDSWGKVISTTGSLADTVGVKNPYRYRGYRYDTETGLYLTKSRYYDSEVCRFISPEPNADYGGFDKGAGLLAYNIYTYCANNPIIHADPSGEWLARAVSGVVGAAVFGTLANLAIRVVGLFTPVSKKVRTGVTLAFAALGGTLGAILGPSFMAKHTPKLLKAIKQIQNRKFNVKAFGPTKAGNIFGITISKTLIIMLHMPHVHRPYFHIQIAVKIGKSKQKNVARINISPKIKNSKWIIGK